MHSKLTYAWGNTKTTFKYQPTKNSNINDHIENISDRHLNRNKVISEMWSGLQIAMVEKNTIIVINISERKFFDVKLHENFILCEQDKSAGCDHTAFVLDAS